jgi:hypothetical protein
MSQKKEAFRVNLILACIAVCGAGLTLAAEGQLPGKEFFASSPGSQAQQIKVKSVALSINPDDSLEASAVSNILTAHLFRAGIKVISTEQVLRTQDALIRKATPEKKSEDENKDSEYAGEEPPFIDGLMVVKEIGGECLIKVTVLGQAVQKNIYDADNRRVLEVRSESRISLITASIVNVDGTIVKVGSIDYEEPVSVAKAAADMGSALVQQLRSK